MKINSQLSKIAPQVLQLSNESLQQIKGGNSPVSVIETMDRNGGDKRKRPTT